MTFLGVDIGSKRVGLAVSQSGIIAEPLSSFEAHDAADLIDRIVHEIISQNVECVVIGVPYRQDGSISEHGELIHDIVASLRDRLPVTQIHTVDEALTSKEAERLGGRAADHDALAAALILEQYFSQQSELVA